MVKIRFNIFVPYALESREPLDMGVKREQVELSLSSLDLLIIVLVFQVWWSQLISERLSPPLFFLFHDDTALSLMISICINRQVSIPSWLRWYHCKYPLLCNAANVFSLPGKRVHPFLFKLGSAAIRAKCRCWCSCSLQNLRIGLSALQSALYLSPNWVSNRESQF